ncbi:hypothetical protein ASG93_30500 [Paenibacillus sp. Soil787]|nr:hypothetical protein ASG93_30500 [Paenibacillus sp. Soil787]
MKPPSANVLKQLQEQLKQLMLEDPMLLNCTNKSLRQAYMKDKIADMGLDEYKGYYLTRDSSHIVELAFAQLKNK